MIGKGLIFILQHIFREIYISNKSGPVVSFAEFFYMSENKMSQFSSALK